MVILACVFTTELGCKTVNVLAELTVRFELEFTRLTLLEHLATE